MRRIVIVGNGIAGMTAADTLRAEGFAGELVLVGEEDHPPYSRPALSKALLRDEDDLNSHLLPPPTHGARELRGVRAVGLDPEGRTVLLDNGEELSYDGLIITTGCRSRRLGSEDAEQLTMRTLDDALALRKRIAGRPAVVVVGGGPLGMEIASGCLDAGCEVTVVTQGPPLQMQLGNYLSALLVAAAQDRGVRVIETAEAHLVGSSEGGTEVMLADGSTLVADLVVTAAGDRPNTEWLESSGLLIDGALLTDSQGRVRADIVAAGDVATVPTPVGVRRVPLWSAAIEQAKVAARALLGTGDDTANPAGVPPYFWTEQFGLALKIVGHLPLRGEPTVLESDPAESKFLLQWTADGEDPAGGAAAAINYRIPIPKLRRLAAGTA